ncbi:hypothetical protein BJY01DRAFT_255476 [Aspergillus pseudoustus]|uniref:Hypervirulence associated protein TUDOR domain-containing protein n=1 Tax=Aspergillus pseudoustus TaxID=1810923 RepID=A0ABR4IK11_9EURO
MPKYSNGMTVEYKPVGGTLPSLPFPTPITVGTPYPRLNYITLTPLHETQTKPTVYTGPDSRTSVSTGRVMSVLTEPNMQADRNVDASARNPRYEVGVKLFKPSL